MDQPIKSLFPLNGNGDLDGAPLGVDGVPITSQDMERVPLKHIDLHGVPLYGDVGDGMQSKFVSMLGP